MENGTKWEAVQLDVHGREAFKEYTARCIDQGGEDAPFYLVLMQKPDGPADVCHTGNGPTSARNARAIAALPLLLDVVHSLCVQLASAGIEAKADSLDPIAALHAKALAAHEAATGDGDPFGAALAGICAQNRAALAASAEPQQGEETSSASDARKDG